MFQCLSNLDSSLRTKRQTLFQKVYCQRAGIGKQSPKWPFLTEREGSYVFTGALGSDRVEIVDRWGPEDVEDYGKLVVIYCSRRIDRHFSLSRPRDTLTVSTWEERFPAQHFSKDTTYTPYIDRAGIFFKCEHNFWGAVPSMREISQELTYRQYIV